MASTPTNGKNKGKAIKATPSNPETRPSTRTREIPTRVRNNLLRFCSASKLDAWIACTKPQHRDFLDYILDLDRQASAHCKYYPRSDDTSRTSKPPRATPKSAEKCTCETCLKSGHKQSMRKCGRCKQWFHPECEPEEPEQLYVSLHRSVWHCEDCQTTIDAQYESDEDDDDEDHPEHSSHGYTTDDAGRSTEDSDE